jgi:Gpi18-like mannosyltransferase
MAPAWGTCEVYRHDNTREAAFSGAHVKMRQARSDVGQRWSLGARPLAFIFRVFCLSRLLIFSAMAVSPWFIAPAIPRWNLDDPLLRPLFRWDAGWYLNIAEYGYAYNGDPTQEHNIVFFPLYPLACRLCHVATGVSIPLCAVVLSNGAFLIGLAALYALITWEIGPEVARYAILLLAFFPTSVFFSIMYTESFFLTFSVLAYTAFRQQRFLAGGIWSGLASATRLPGILLGVPLLFAAFPYLKDRRRWWPVIVAGLLAMSGILAFLFYLWTAFGDPLATFRVQQQAPGWQREFAFPFRSVKAGLKQTLSSHFSPAPVDAWLVLLFIALACALPWYLSTSYAVYSLLCLALPLCTTAGIWSFSRYASVIFPVFMLLGIVGQRSRWRVGGLVAIFGVLLAIFSMRYAQWHWVA